jgi:superfamily II DNA or RNA helicase
MNFRARGCDYAFIVAELQKNGVIFEDKARKFAPLDELTPAVKFVPRTHQNSAFNAWKANASRGIAALPTGSGKTMLAIMATAYLKCPTIFLVPTLDLLGQWAEVLGHYFNCEIGMLGGGERSIRELTVSTYDSAVLNMEFIGDRFGFLVADECHHLPGPETRLAGAMAIAPYRLGLSATPELPDDRAAVLEDLLGPIVCRVEIGELAGTVLSPYHTVSMPVKLDPDEAEAYEFNRKKYTDFLAANRLNFHYKSEWGRFLGLCARLPGGRDVFRAFIEQRRIARGGEAKIRAVWNLVTRHAAERIIIFTADNATAYDLGRRFFWPVITHHTRPQERKEFLGFFREGKYLVLVTSKVLNEGVDVPSVAVGIVLSGSASVREHVQRLGRILRPAPGKEQAVLYELVSAGTSEESVSARRREHKAYSE